jgi:hypothetical protein
MSELARRHAADRGRMLSSAVAILENDDRFVAAWLAGSFGRDEQNDLSDIDLWVVVTGPHAVQLCRRTHQVGAGTTAERLAVISRLGRPAVIHENHHNAPPAGSFTSCIYAETGVMIDWVFIPVISATRARDSQLLFDHFGVAVTTPEIPLSRDARIAMLSEQVAFFWMMTRPTLKAMHRDDLVQFHLLLDVLLGTVENIERMLAEQPARYRRGSCAPLLTTDAARREFVTELCRRVEELHPAIVADGAAVPKESAAIAARWLEAQ